jgi:hypothetical protein
MASELIVKLKINNKEKQWKNNKKLNGFVGSGAASGH